MYAEIVDGNIVAIGNLPSGARRIDDGRWILPPKKAWAKEEHEACGWFEVVDAPRPDDTETTTYEYDVVAVAGIPTVTWTPRLLAPSEIMAKMELQAPTVAEVLAAKIVETANAAPVAWSQPQGAHDAYLPGTIVTDGPSGDRYQNVLSIPNVWGLTVHGWVNLDATPPIGPQPWSQPLGAHDAYQIGDRVTFNGGLYESLIAANTYSPTAYPAGWLLITT